MNFFYVCRTNCFMLSAIFSSDNQKENIYIHHAIICIHIDRILCYNLALCKATVYMYDHYSKTHTK